MVVPLSVLKENPAKYFYLAKTNDIIITKRGKRLGRIVNEETAMTSNKRRAIEELIGSAVFPPEYNDPNHDPDYDLLRESSFKDRGLL